MTIPLVECPLEAFFQFKMWRLYMMAMYSTVKGTEFVSTRPFFLFYIYKQIHKKKNHFEMTYDKHKNNSK